MIKTIIINNKKVGSIKRKHPWIFSGAIYSKPENLEEGDLVRVTDSKDEQLGVGHYQSGRISVRLIHFGPEEIPKHFWTQLLKNAYQLRHQIGLIDNNNVTTCYRLIHGEGDGLPGLIIDIYGSTAVIQCHAIGMHRTIKQLAEGLKQVYGNRLKAIYDKSMNSLPEQYTLDKTDGYIYGSATGEYVKENGHQFIVNWEEGQKTGFFLDQRENRELLKRYSKDKKVLNTFCYTGGFSVYALAAKANLVHSVDSSASAIDLTNQNIALNNLPEDQHESFTEDVLNYLKETETDYEVIILDPPAYAKRIRQRHKAVQGYKRLNALAMKKIAPGGIVFTFSCSQVIDFPLFYNTIVAAALEAQRSIRVLHQVFQPADHPVSIYHPEGAYLKGLVLRVD